MPTQDISIWEETGTYSVDVTSDNKIKTKTKLSDDTTDFEIDSFKKGIVMIDHVHRQGHLGKVYDSTNHIDNIDNNTHHYILIDVPNGTYPHFFFEIHSVYGILVDLYESPTITANGTAIDKINHNRNSVNTATVNIYHTPTITLNGTRLLTTMGGAGKQATGGEYLLGREYLLKTNTKYLIDIKSLSNGNMLCYLIGWYE